MLNIINAENGLSNICLTYEEEHVLRDYFRMQDAMSVLDCYGIKYEDKTEEELVQLGQALEDAIYDNVGDVEIAVLENMGYEGIGIVD